MGDETTAERPVVTLTLTAQELLSVYKAGIKRGNDEATSWEWGSRPDSNLLDALEEAMIWNFDRSILPGSPEEKQAAWDNIKKAISDV